MERVDPTDSLTLSTCFEDSLKSDPTCSESLAKLISLHQNGMLCLDTLLIHELMTCGASFHNFFACPEIGSFIMVDLMRINRAPDVGLQGEKFD